TNAGTPPPIFARDGSNPLLHHHLAFRLDTAGGHFYVYLSPLSRPGALMSIQMELHKIIISEMQDQQIIVLKEVDGERKFPIGIATVVPIFVADHVLEEVSR